MAKRKNKKSKKKQNNEQYNLLQVHELKNISNQPNI